MNFLHFIKDFFYFKGQNKSSPREFKMSWNDIYPCLNDDTLKSTFDAHYVYHVSWATRVLRKINPIKHIDISSSIYFSSIVSAFYPIEFFDYRPIELSLSNYTSKFADLLDLPFDSASITSLSCMHVIEHIGLGRYGDPLNQNGDLCAIKEICRVMASKGNLIFVVPIGKERKIQYNAHRIYLHQDILEYFNSFNLNEFSLIDDNGLFLENASFEDTCQCEYGCGCYWFVKK